MGKYESERNPWNSDLELHCGGLFGRKQLLDLTYLLKTKRHRCFGSFYFKSCLVDEAPKGAGLVQQNGVKCILLRDDILNFLWKHFLGHLIFAHVIGCIPWPQESSDLSPRFLFLWGYLTEIGYNENPFTPEDLKRTTIAEINRISRHIILNKAMMMIIFL